MKRLLLLGMLLLAAGCSYYNGMYNANRLARAAEKAERGGRTLQAQSLWGQAALKAESTLARHPDSKWADDALVLRGRALERLGNCAAAVGVLERAVTLTGKAELLDRAYLSLGLCRERLGDPAAAAEAYARVAHSPESALRDAARFRYGHALRIAGRWQEALAVLDGVGDRRAAGERAVALGGLGRVAECVAVADSLVAAADSLAPWDSLLAVLGRADPAAASALTDRRIAMPGTARASAVRWLIADGVRLGGRSTGDGLRRLDEAAGTADRPELAGPARLASALLLMGQVRTPAELAPIAALLDSIAAGSGPASTAAERLGASIRRIRSEVDTVTPDTPAGDIRLFYAAESAHDSLELGELAASLYGRVAELWPTSPYAPKALLAQAGLQPDRADSLLRVVMDRYGASPYVRLARGGDAVEVRQLEDSLRTFAQAAAPRAPPRPLRPRDTDRPEPEDRARRRPAAEPQ